MRTIIGRPGGVFITRLLVFSVCVCVGSQAFAVFQEEDEGTSSRREEAAIKAIEDAGGRVYRISAADETREVSCYLSSNPIKDQHLESIGAINNVIWLNLANTEISNEGLKWISNMPLTKLHLEKTKIGDDGLQHLKSLKDLEYLNLYGTKVTDAGLEHLSGLKNLKKLYVWQSGVTDEGINKLQDALPDLEIVGEVKLTPVVVEEPKAEPEKTKPADKAADDTAKKKAAEDADKKPAAKKGKGKGKKKAPDKKSSDTDKAGDGKSGGD